MSQKILYICNHAAFFVSHRINLIQHAKLKGYEVILLIGQSASSSMELSAENVLKDNKVNYKRCLFTPSNKNFLFDFIGLLQIFFTIIKFKPNIIHSISPKANLLCIFSTFLQKNNTVIFSISGLGYLYSGNKNFFKNIFKFINETSFNFFLKYKNNYKIIVQNIDDKLEFKNKYSLSSKNIHIIPSSGVKLINYDFDINLKEKLVILPARLLESKGVNEYIQCSIKLKKKYPDWKFILLGAADYKSPDAIPLSKIQFWLSRNIIEYWGYSNNINEIFRKCSIVCLPSYREGFPKCILEASLNYCAIVTTNVIGCKDSIINNKTGILVKNKDVNSLYNAIEKLIINKQLRKEYGINGNRFVNKNFDINKITKKIFEVYKD